MLEGEEANLMDVANAEGVYGTHLVRYRLLEL